MNMPDWLWIALIGQALLDWLMISEITKLRRKLAGKAGETR